MVLLKRCKVRLAIESEARIKVAEIETSLFAVFDGLKNLVFIAIIAW